MESQNSKNIWPVMLVVVITALVVGGSVYWWTKSTKSTPTTQESQNAVNKQTETAQPKTLNEYLGSYQKTSATLTDAKLKMLAKVFSLDVGESCNPSESEMCDPKTLKIPAGLALYSDKNWSDGKVHEFYFEFGVEGPPLYYGPFQDNVLKLSQEASQRKDIIR